MNRAIQKIVPPDKWKLPVAIAVGALVGLFIYIFNISNAISYLSDKPETCINCHIMVPQYATWQHSSHRQNATCNDCHVPHNNVVNKYFFKAKDGLRHATIFTLRKEPQVIFIKEEGKQVVHNNCIRCHNDLLDDSKLEAKTNFNIHSKTERECWECHREVPHGRVNSISSTPYARIPVETPTVPQWLMNSVNKIHKQQ
jgi:cytochrome c nitrite reductase small subunit